LQVVVVAEVIGIQFLVEMAELAEVHQAPLV
jgi:hypothetical protein